MPQKTSVEPTLVLPVPLSPRKGQTLSFFLVSPSIAKPYGLQGQKGAGLVEDPRNVADKRLAVCEDCACVSKKYFNNTFEEVFKICRIRKHLEGRDPTAAFVELVLGQISLTNGC